MTSPHTSLAVTAGWVGVGFLIGVVAHSVWPTTPVSMIVLSGAVALATVVTILGWKTPRVRLIGLCLLALIAGVWRFEVARPTMPRGLVFGSPRGLAYVSSDVRVSDDTDPRYWLGRGRRALTVRAQTRLTTDQSALLTGLLYGERDLSKPLKDRFRRAGLLHLVAVSGSNVTIIAVIVMQFLIGIGLARRQAFVALALALVTFVLFVSPSASVVRAAIMGLLIECAPLVGRVPRPSRLLLVSALVFVGWKPWALVFDASFALSFLAMWGLLTWGTWLDARLRTILPQDLLRGILAATVGATLMTIPYTAWAFGQLTVWGLVTGFLALPLVPWAMGFGAIALALPVWPWALLPAQGFLELILGVARLPDLIPLGVWSHLAVSWQMMIGGYILLFMLWRSVQKKNKLIHISSSQKSEDLVDAQVVSRE